MPPELSFLDQLEEWLEDQVPTNLHDLPYKMLETMERVSNEIFESLNIHGPPSISIPFPPFIGKEAPPPPPPAPPMPVSIYNKANKVAHRHPYAVGGLALGMTVGLGLGAFLLRRGVRGYRLGHYSTRGRVEDGMLKEAIVLLAPSPLPPILIPLAATLLKAGYIVLIAVPQVKEAELLERKLSALEERSSLRVLIYDPEDSATFPPFHRSLLATLTLRYPAIGRDTPSDPYNPHPAHVPHIHAFVSLYPLNPSPPSQPGALPALPTLLAPNANGRAPKLITLYPSTSVLATPDTFASQVLTTTHRLLSQNLAVSSSAKIVSVFVGDIVLPTMPAILSAKPLSRREQARLQMRNTSARQKASFIRAFLVGSFTGLYARLTGHLGIGKAGKEYATFERGFLRVVKRRHGDWFSLGQLSWFPLVLSRIHPVLLGRLLPILPALPSATGPSPATPPKAASAPSTPSASMHNKATASASSSDHEEDLTSSIHTHASVSSGQAAESEGSGSGGLDGSWVDSSWVGLESSN